MTTAGLVIQRSTKVIKILPISQNLLSKTVKFQNVRVKSIVRATSKVKSYAIIILQTWDHVRMIKVCSTGAERKEKDIC